MAVDVTFGEVKDQIVEGLRKNREATESQAVKDEANTESLKKAIEGGSAETEKLSSQITPAKQSDAFKNGLRGFLGIDFVENFKKIGTGFEKIGDTISKKLDKIVVAPVKSFFGGLFDAVKLGIALVGGVIALQGFMDGWEKASDWFEGNVDWTEKISSAITGVIQAFTGLSDEEAKKLAEKINHFVEKIQTIATEFFNIIGIITGFKEGGLLDLTSSIGTIFSELGFIGTALVGLLAYFKFGGTISGLFSMISSAFSALIPLLSTMAAFFGVSLLPFIAAATAIVAGVVITVRAIYKSLEAAYKTFQETGSIMETLKVLTTEFFAQLYGWPTKLIADLVDWVAELFGFDPIFGEDFDPVSTIRENLTGLFTWFENLRKDIVNSIKDIGTFFYDSKDGSVLGVVWGKLFSDVGQTFTDAYNWIVSKVSDIAKFYYNPEDGSIFGIVWGQLITDVGQTFTNAYNWAKNKVLSIGKFFYDPEDGSVLGIVWGNLVNDVGQTFTGAYNVSSFMILKLVQF